MYLGILRIDHFGLNDFLLKKHRFLKGKCLVCWTWKLIKTLEISFSSSAVSIISDSNYLASIVLAMMKCGIQGLLNGRCFFFFFFSPISFGFESLIKYFMMGYNVYLRFHQKLSHLQTISLLVYLFISNYLISSTYITKPQSEFVLQKCCSFIKS